MNQKLSVAAQSILPPIIWNALQRARGRAAISPWREFGHAATTANAMPILQGEFAGLYEKYQPLDPHVRKESWRYRLYNVASFARLCRSVPGDFVCAGVSWGIAPRIVFDYVDFLTLGKTMHFIDPFEGIVANDSAAVSPIYNQDPDYVLRQYPPGSPVTLHKKRIPLRMDRPLAFVFTDTGNPDADAASIPIFYEDLSPGGIIISEQYANNIQHYDRLGDLGIFPIWLPSGQGVIFKPRA